MNQASLFSNAGVIPKPIDSCTDSELLQIARYVLTHPREKYDVVLLRYLFPEAPILDNFGIKSSDVQKRIDELKWLFLDY